VVIRERENNVWNRSDLLLGLLIEVNFTVEMKMVTSLSGMPVKPLLSMQQRHMLEV